MEKNMDRRVKRTREQLKRALAQELTTKNLNEITVMRLSELADINRATFYLHFKDVYDLYQRTEQEVLDTFGQLVTEHLMRPSTRLLPVLSEAFEFIAQNQPICLAIFKVNGAGFLEQIVERCRPKSAKEWQKLLGVEALREYRYAFITSGCIGLMQTWMRSGMKESPRDMSALAEELMTKSISNVSKK